MVAMSDVLLAGGYLIWILLLIARQLALIGPWLARRDVFHRLPSWSYFRDPLRHDYAIVRRSVDESGHFAPWEIVASAMRRTLVNAVWNPREQADKAMRVAVTRLRKQQRAGWKQGVYSPAYLSLLQFSLRGIRDPKAIAAQFAVVAYRSHDPHFEPVLVIASEFHDLETAGRD